MKSKAEMKSGTIASGSQLANLEYSMKHKDWHRRKYDFGDWTDDSDQMMLILLSLIDNNGEVTNYLNAVAELSVNLRQTGPMAVITDHS